MATATGRADGSVIIDTKVDTGGFSKGANNLKQQFGSMGSMLKKFGGVIAAAFSVKAIVSFGKEAIDLGSDLQEVQNVVDVTFTTMNEQVNEFARNAAATAGLSETMAKRYTGTFGAMAKSFGFAEADAYGMSTALTQLTGDVASFYNLSQDAAYTKLKSVFTGETESLKDLGVVMTQTALDDFAMRKGIGKTVNQMAEQEKVALRYQFVLDQLSGASGDFVRTQDSWANQTRILNLQMEQLKATIGQGLINMLTPVIKMLNTVIAKLMQFANAFKSITEAFFGNASGGGGGGIAGALESAADGAGELEENTKAAGKAAQKALMGFDELNKLSEPSGGGGAVDSSGGVSLDALDLGLTGANGETSSQMQGLVDKIQELIAPLEEIDLTPLTDSISGLGEAFSGFSSVLSEVFSWVWYNILAPLAEWTIEESAPALVDALSAAFDGLSATLDVLFSAIEECWDELEPVFSWIGETVLKVLQNLKEIGQGISAKWKENEPKIKQTFQNIGTVIENVWAVIGPILTWLRDALRELIKDGILDELQLLFDRIYAISEILAGIVNGDFSQVMNGFGAAIGAETDYAESKIKSFADTLGIDLDAVDQCVKQVMESVGKQFSDTWAGIVEVWECVASWFNENVIVPLQEFWAPIGEWFGELFGSIQQTLDDVFYNIGVIAEGCWQIIQYVWGIASGWFDENVAQPIQKKFEEIWGKNTSFATEAYLKIKEEFAPIAEFFDEIWSGLQEKAEEAWNGVKKVFSGIAQWGKEILNELIAALNGGLTNIFSGINRGLERLKGLELGDSKPFGNIRTITTPQIPYLAKGAVIPPNAPFMAMLGDQRHGTNIEAPLSTIQEAVANVMEDYSAANMAGHGATVAVLREILEAVLGIEIGDDVIASAVQRHQAKMAIVRGG